MEASLLAMAMTMIVMGGVLVGAAILRAMNTQSYNVLPRSMRENQFGHSAASLLDEVDEVLKRCSMPAPRKAQVKQQTREVADNIARALWKLHHLRRVRQIAARTGASRYAAQVAREVTEMEAQLLQEIDRSLEVLFSVPLSLMKVELAHGDRVADRLVSELSETNRRMREIAATYEELKTSESDLQAAAMSTPAQSSARSR